MKLSINPLSLWQRFQSIFITLGTLLCGIFVAQISWHFISPNPTINTPKIVSVQTQSNSTNWLNVAKEVSNRAFFGTEVIEETNNTPEEPVDAPETNLAVTLHGIFAQGDGQGYALIAQQGGQSKVFTISDDIFGQATLSAVYSDRVLLDRNGAIEILRYEQNGNSELLQSVNKTTPNDSSTYSATSSFSSAIEQANQAIADGADINQQVSSMMSFISQKANDNPQAFIEELGLASSSQGYQVTRRARQLQMIGLRPGDIITSVNDVPVGNVSNDQALLNQIMTTGGEIKVNINRGGRTFTLYQSIPRL